MKRTRVLTEQESLTLGELAHFEHLITKQYPAGIVSIVSDTWDFWQVVTQFLPTLKDKIMAREGKVVIRPDSGDPVAIVCGDPAAETECERKGLIECLWDTFGGTTNEKGYRSLDPHIGAIYGDSITLDRCQNILELLYQKKFAPDNIVFGIGSYTYEYVTRDTLGFAVKATAGQIKGKYVPIFKSPKTDGGMKKSAKGFLRVDMGEDGEYHLVDNVTREEMQGGALEEVFRNGVLLRASYLNEIRTLIDSKL